MASINEMERDAAKILEFYDFNQSNQNQMVEDMNLCHKGKYSRSTRREMFKTILESSTKKQKILKYITLKRSLSSQRSLESVMTDEKVEKVIAEHNHQDEDAIKYWFYDLHPSFTATEIADRHEVAIFSISQREIDQYPHKDELMLHAEHWMEYYEFNFPEFEVEIARDLYRSMTQFLYEGLTARMCLKILKNVYNDQASARMKIDNKMTTDKTPISDADIQQALRKVRAKYKFKKRSVEDKSAFVKQLFISNWDDFTIDEIKEVAEKFYTKTVGTVEHNAEDVAGSVVVIESEDDDEGEDEEDEGEDDEGEDDEGDDDDDDDNDDDDNDDDDNKDDDDEVSSSEVYTIDDSDETSENSQPSKKSRIK